MQLCYTIFKYLQAFASSLTSIHINCLNIFASKTHGWHNYDWITCCLPTDTVLSDMLLLNPEPETVSSVPPIKEPNNGETL